MNLATDLQQALGGRPLERQIGLSSRTSIRVGGAAEILAVPHSEQELSDAIKVCGQYGFPYYVLGAGTNTLVSDSGVKGVIFSLDVPLINEQVGDQQRRSSFLLAAGTPLSRLIKLAQGQNCVGMEFFAGIPGTVGGAIVMNAGTKQGSAERICTEIGVCLPQGSRTLTAAEVGFGYRSTNLPPQAIVTWGKFSLPKGDATAVASSKAAINSYLTSRRASQPLDMPNFGSVFKNPPGEAAARLIEGCGLKGRRQGGAQISAMHANFIVNCGEATASDVLALMRLMQDAVLDKYGVQLDPEVKLMGEFDAQKLPRGLTPVKRTAA